MYLKELDDAGFVVYSNWGSSKKSQDVASNPQASLTFFWREMERQVRVEGVTQRLSGEESQVYFDTRFVRRLASPTKLFSFFLFFLSNGVLIRHD